MQNDDMSWFMRWFPSGDTKLFGEQLADTIAKRYPVTLQSPDSKKVSVDRISRILEDAYKLAKDYQSSKRLGIWGKTRLAHAFKWRMKEIGYKADFVDMATEGLLVYLNKKN